MERSSHKRLDLCMNKGYASSDSHDTAVYSRSLDPIYILALKAKNNIHEKMKVPLQYRERESEWDRKGERQKKKEAEKERGTKPTDKERDRQTKSEGRARKWSVERTHPS